MIRRRLPWRDMRPRVYITREGLVAFDAIIGLDGHFWAQIGRVVFTTSPK